MPARRIVRQFIGAPRLAAFRWWLFYLHLIAGVAFGLYFVVVGLTGSVVVFEPEVSRATMPSPAVRGAATSHLPLNLIVERVNAAYPDHRISFIRS